MSSKMFILSLILLISTCLTVHSNTVEEPNQESEYFSSYFKKVEESASWLKEHTNNSSPLIVITLTGGTSIPESMLENQQIFSSSDIPHFPTAKVQGHDGKLIFAQFNGRDVVILRGRFHYYEGLTPQEVVFPYFVLNKMGAKYLITSNAAGAINYRFNPGDIMLITDQINAMGNNPLRGLAVQQIDNQFPDMTEAYNPDLQSIAKQAAIQLNITLQEGVYLATSVQTMKPKARSRHFVAGAQM
jgi:purine-nucleoside phosphorylase